MRLITTKELRALHIATRHHHLINGRLAIFRYADEYGFNGFNGAARQFGLDRKTVRTWHRRWVVSGPARLVPRQVIFGWRIHRAMSSTGMLVPAVG